MVCVRRAWLELGALVVQLHDESKGYYVAELDLGSPEVREVTSPRPDKNGVDDRTLFMGGRVVSVTVVAVASAGAQIDQVAAQFGPFMVPAARPILHYVLDRPGAPERTIALRAQSYDWKVDNDYQRDIQLAWMAPDPVVHDVTVQSITVSPATDTGELGRTYNEVPPRTYPPGEPAPAAGANAYNAGDVAVYPTIRINGPVTNPNVTTSDSSAGGKQSGRVPFTGGLVIDAGKYVLVDCANRVAYRDGDPALDVTSFINWSGMQANGGWPLFQARHNHWCGMLGSSTTPATNAVLSWSNGYLS